MSISSSSFHVRGLSLNRVSVLLKTNGCRSYVFPTETSWVSFVCNIVHSDRDDWLKWNFSNHPVLRYAYEEDFYWQIQLSQANRIVWQYEASWVNSDRIQAVQVESTELCHILGLDCAADFAAELQRKFTVSTVAELFEEEPYETVPTLLGIEWFSGLSFESIDANYDEIAKELPGLIKIT